MDPDKLAKWLELAKRFNGSEFWEDIFQEDAAKQMNDPSVWTGRGGSKTSPPFPPIELLKTASELIVLIELPGIPKESVQLSLSGDRLIVKGTAPRLYPHAEILHSERASGGFERTITLPEPFAEQHPGIKATFSDGLLDIRIPLKKRPEKSIRIE